MLHRIAASILILCLTACFSEAPDVGTDSSSSSTSEPAVSSDSSGGAIEPAADEPLASEPDAVEGRNTCDLLECVSLGWYCPGGECFDHIIGPCAGTPECQCVWDPDNACPYYGGCPPVKFSNYPTCTLCPSGYVHSCQPGPGQQGHGCLHGGPGGAPIDCSP